MAYPAQHRVTSGRSQPVALGTIENPAFIVGSAMLVGLMTAFVAAVVTLAL
jgi:hypothetical protein